jgi:Asp-tRNA(Asn)/Glu-tRNA(Gln) amidotransferase A subunit family amidase
MSYDVKPVKAPRAAGWSLKALAAVVESRPGAALLGATLLEGAGVPDFRTALADDPPWPLASPRRVDDPAPAGGPPADLSPLEALAAGPSGGSLPWPTAADYADAYRAGRTDPGKVAEALLDACAAANAAAPPLRAIVAQDAADVRAQARASTQRWREGRPLSALDGVPVAVKDELDQVPYPTTVGTGFLGDVAREDAAVVARLRAAGALLIGKANMHEIGIGVTGVNPHHGAARNPYDPARATGGSSSGPAAAVASGLCPLALGADGGGSIRLPSALCGVVGLKPTFGRVSEVGAAPLCWSVAHVGPIGATVRDVALGYALIAGMDAGDPNTRPQPRPTVAGLEEGDLHGVRVGVYGPWFDHADPAVVSACRAALDVLTAAGAEVREIDLPELDLLRTVHLVTIVSEMASAHARYDPQHRREYGADTRLSLALARMLTARDYVHAQRLRTRLLRHFDTALEDVDVIASPTSACTAPLIPNDSLATGESNLEMTTRIMRFAQPGNLTGLPALTVPAGYDPDGLPIGFQLMGRAWDEALLLRLGRVVERGVPRQAPRVRFDPLESASPRHPG